MSQPTLEERAREVLAAEIPEPVIDVYRRALRTVHKDPAKLERAARTAARRNAIKRFIASEKRREDAKHIDVAAVVERVAAGRPERTKAERFAAARGAVASYLDRKIGGDL